MGTRILDRAFAAANLFRLSWPPHQIKEITFEWAKRQAAQSVESINDDAAKLSVIDHLGQECSGRLFLSFHYSVYPNLYRSLGKRSTDDTVFSLIGHQTKEHCATLQSLARKEGISIHFVQSGFKMISEMRAGLNHGHAGLILLDIPWSRNGSTPDQRYPAFGGSFSVLSTLERLVDLIDRNREVITTTRNSNKQVHLLRDGHLTFQDAFIRLGQLIESDPADYERLHQLHRFFTFDSKTAALVTFRANGQRYAIETSAMRTLRLEDNHALNSAENTAHGLSDDHNTRLRLSRSTGVPIEYVLCL